MSAIRLTVLFLVVTSLTSTASATSEKSGRQSTSGRRGTSSRRGHKSVRERLGLGHKEPKPPIDLKALEGEWVGQTYKGELVRFNFHVNEDGTFNYNSQHNNMELWNMSLSNKPVEGEESTRITVSFTNADGEFSVTENIKVSFKDNPDFDQKSGRDLLVETWTLDPKDKDVIHLKLSMKILIRTHHVKMDYHREGHAQNTTAPSAGPLMINKEERKRQQQQARIDQQMDEVFQSIGRLTANRPGERQ